MVFRVSLVRKLLDVLDFFKMAPIHGDTARHLLIFLFIFSSSIHHSHCSKEYTSQELHSLRHVPIHLDNNIRERLNLIEEIIGDSTQNSHDTDGASSRPGRRRGKRGCVLVRTRQRNNKAPLSSIIQANVRSVRNKVDELQCNINS